MGLMSICPNCGSDWCSTCDCVKRDLITKLKGLPWTTLGTGHLQAGKDYVPMSAVHNLIKELEKGL